MSIRMTIPNVSVAHIFWETINRNHGLGIVISSPEIEREQGISLVFRWDGLTIGKVCDAEGSSLLGPQLHFVLADKVFRNHIHTWLWPSPVPIFRVSNYSHLFTRSLHHPKNRIWDVSSWQSHVGILQFATLALNFPIQVLALPLGAILPPSRLPQKNAAVKSPCAAWWSPFWCAAWRLIRRSRRICRRRSNRLGKRRLGLGKPCMGGLLFHLLPYCGGLPS